MVPLNRTFLFVYRAKFNVHITMSTIIYHIDLQELHIYDNIKTKNDFLYYISDR